MSFKWAAAGIKANCYSNTAAACKLHGIGQYPHLQYLRERGEIPAGIKVDISGAADQMDATREALIGNYGVALLIIYLLLVAIFNHWGCPLLIMTSIPLGIAGGRAQHGGASGGAGSGGCTPASHRHVHHYHYLRFGTAGVDTGSGHRALSRRRCDCDVWYPGVGTGHSGHVAGVAGDGVGVGAEVAGSDCCYPLGESANLKLRHSLSEFIGHAKQLIARCGNGVAGIGDHAGVHAHGCDVGIDH